MGPRLTTLFLLPLLLLVAVPLASASDSASTVPLDWSDSKLELKPGYYITVSVHAEGNGIVGLADAGFKLEDSDGTSWLFGITQDGRNVYIVMEGAGYVAWLDYLEPYQTWKTSYDDTFYVKVYCPDEAPPNWNPIEGYIWVEVRDQYTGTTRYYIANDPGPGGVVLNLYWFTESTYGISSKVTLGEPTKYSDCGDKYGGDLPGGGESRDGENTTDPNMIEKYMMYGIAAIVGLAAFAIIVNRLT